MTSYEIEFTKSAQKELSKLPSKTRLRIAKAIYQLRENPRTGNTRSMVGIPSWRLRVGDYRVVYDITDQKLTILVVRVRHRRDIYKQL
ncbi:type II toxin-antitoxin system RelE/ParE family toxin [Patescibacteria group bacterium]|nr:MAG: type II toxin-antitoxin system RelE/ParE family toxin [Patescibacteria group bacterium]